MNAQDRRRLLKLDESILEIEEQIEYAIALEKTTGRANFLQSKVLRTKLERQLKQRSHLMRSVNDKLTRQQTYDLILKERKDAVIRVEGEIVNIQLYLEDLGARILINYTEDLKQQFNDMRRLLASKKLVLLNKERAVMNWLAKDSSQLPIKRSISMRSNYGKFKEELKERVLNKEMHTRAEFDERQPEDILDELHDWKLKIAPAKAENSATVALVTPPADYKPLSEAEVKEIRKKVVIDFDE